VECGRIRDEKRGKKERKELLRRDRHKKKEKKMSRKK
jgi:hypothetical protein